MDRTSSTETTNKHWQTGWWVDRILNNSSSMYVEAHITFSTIVTVKAHEQTNQIYSWFKCQKVPFNSWYKYLSTCKQAHLKCASYMFASIERFNSMYAFSWCVEIILISCFFWGGVSLYWIFFLFFFFLFVFGKVCKNHSEAAVWITASKHAGDRDQRGNTSSMPPP